MNRRPFSSFLPSLTGALALALAGCGESSGTDDANRRSAPESRSAQLLHAHAHAAPHGGTLVQLGDEQFHLEFVLDAAEGTLTAWVLDDHVEEFVRLTAPSIDLAARMDGMTNTVSLRAVATAATGESVGDTSMFSGTAGWLKNATRFTGVIPELAIQGRAFSNITFTFPDGNE